MMDKMSIRNPESWTQVITGSLQRGTAITWALGKHKGWMLEYDSKQGRRRTKWFSYAGDAMKWYDRYTKPK